MSEKVKVTKEQADALEYVARGNFRITMIKAYMKMENYSFNQEQAGSLYELSHDDFFKALYIGYEVELEFKLNDFITNVRTGVTIKLDNEERVDFVNHRYCDKGNVRLATKIEAEHEERKITDKKLDKLLLDLNSEERIKLYRKLDCRLDIEVE